MSRNTKIIIISVAAILIIGLSVYGIIVWRKGNTNGNGFFGGGLPDTGGENGNGAGNQSGAENTGNNYIPSGSLPEGGTLPITQEEKQKLIQLTKDPIIGATIKARENKILYFKQGTGHLYEISFDGNGGESRISNITTTDIIDAQWSRDSSYALLTTNTANSAKSVWIHRTGTSTIERGIFTDTILSASFSALENKLVSSIYADGSYGIYTSTPTGSSRKKILTTTIPDYEVAWPAKNTIALKTRTSAFSPSLFQLQLIGSSPSVVESEKYGFDVLWNSDGTKYLAMETKRDSYAIELSLHDRAISKAYVLTFKTLPEKCVFSKKTSALYCATPRDLGPDPLPDAWWQGKTEFEDVLWRIDPTDNKTSPLLEGGGFDMTHLFLSPDENYIFFTNKKDSTLWSLKLQ